MLKGYGQLKDPPVAMTADAKSKILRNRYGKRSRFGGVCIIMHLDEIIIPSKLAKETFYDILENIIFLIVGY